jgi:uncharacterized membrane protein
MNKETYLQDLRKALKILPQSDRDEAIEFYEEYFEDAGIENEAKVIEELGEPKILAKKILVDVVDRKYEESIASSAEPTPVQALPVVTPMPVASGYDTNTTQAFDANTAAYQAAPGVQPQPAPQYQQQETKEEKTSALKTLMIVLAAIFALPLSPVIFALLIVALTLIFVMFIVYIAFLASGIAMIAAGFGTIVFGIIAFFLNPIAAIVILGSGLCSFGLGIFFAVGSIALIRGTAHGLAKGLSRFVHKKNKKNKAKNAVA